MFQNMQEFKWRLRGVLVRHVDATLRAINQRGLYGGEVVEEVYKLLTENELARILFPKKDPKDRWSHDGAFSKIADDTCPGGCGSREAYMRYGYFSVVRFNGTCFAVGLGRKWPAGYYVGESYKNDIMILWSSTEINNQEKLRRAINNQWCGGFARSPIIGMKDGDLQFGPHLEYRPTADWLKHELELPDFRIAIDDKGNPKEGTAIWKFFPRADGGIMWRRELPMVIAKKIINHLTTNGLH